MGNIDSSGSGIAGDKCRRLGWMAAALFAVLLATTVIPRRTFIFRNSKKTCELADSRKYTGIVEDCDCGFETVDSLNKKVLHPILQELVGTPFFRYFKWHRL